MSENEYVVTACELKKCDRSTYVKLDSADGSKYVTSVGCLGEGVIETIDVSLTFSFVTVFEI